MVFKFGAATWQVLEGILSENDSCPEAWYLLALCHHGAGELFEAMELVQQGTELATKLGIPKDEEIFASFEELRVGYF